MTLNIEKIEEILKFYSSFFKKNLPYYFTYIANSEEEAREMTEEIIIDGKNYGQDIEGVKLTEKEKNVFRKMVELKKKTDINLNEKKELDKLMNEFIRIKIAHATASDEEVNDFIKREKGSRGKIQLTEEEVKNGVKEMARLKQYLNRFYVSDPLNIVEVLSVNGGKIELREVKEEELKKIYNNNYRFYYFNEKKLIDKPVKETYNIDDKLFFHIIDNINKKGRYSIYLKKNENGISMAYTVLKYCFEKNIIKIDGKYTEGGFISYIYEKNINIDNDAFIKILCEVGDYNSVMFLINIFSIQNYKKKIQKIIKKKVYKNMKKKFFLVDVLKQYIFLNVTVKLLPRP